jgi:hypothetical protein
LDQLVAPLPAELRARVIDVTPAYVFGEAPTSLVPYRRHAECMQWLQANGGPQTPWLALDDRASLFAPYCEQLILCDSLVGITDAPIARLASALTRARQKFGQNVDAVL